jgi:hypothetical protein
MPGTVVFRYDEVNDVHFAHPRWQVDTEEDCREWYAQYERYFAPLKRKVDVIFSLDDFRIGPKIGSVWGKYRADMVSRFTRYSVRVHAQARVSTFNATSAALYGGGFEEARDIATALEFIRARRRADEEK